MDWIPWAPLAAASLHIVEEFVLPGGFPAWDRAYRPGLRRSTRSQMLLPLHAPQVRVYREDVIGTAAKKTQHTEAAITNQPVER